jgi:magnesium-transporting ATPase (P-type)
MSIIIKDEFERIIMFTKGADSAIIPRCSADNPFKDITIDYSN